MKRPSGFTLIEVLVAVAIVAVLAAIGGLAYGHYVIKARVVEGLNLPMLLDCEWNFPWRRGVD